MPEFLHLLPPDTARARWLAAVTHRSPTEVLPTSQAVGRVTAQSVRAPQDVPPFPRSEVDGYAVRAADTYGASEALPAYLELVGEVPMGGAAGFRLRPGQAALIHTGGMLPEGADAVVMVEYTQVSRVGEVEILRPVAVGEGVIAIGEDMRAGAEVVAAGVRLRPAEIGALMALGITALHVAQRPRVAVLATGDEVVPPERSPAPGQVRDVNSYTLSALIAKAGGEAVLYGIIPDERHALEEAVRRAFAACDALVVTAGSSASTRDITAEVLNGLGAPGVLVHGVSTKPGRPTILGAAQGKPLVGLPGNPVSALVNAGLFVVPMLDHLQGVTHSRPKAIVRARVTVNLASEAGREDWWPVRLHPTPSGWEAEPIFYKSNLIFRLAEADGLLKVPADATGLALGEEADVVLWE